MIIYDFMNTCTILVQQYLILDLLWPQGHGEGWTYHIYGLALCNDRREPAVSYK